MKKIYCVNCGKENVLNEDTKYCAHCGKKLYIDNNTNETEEENSNVSIATKFMYKKSELIFCLILVPILIIGVGVGLTFLFDSIAVTILIILISCLISFLLDFLIYFMYKRDENYPDDCILFNEKTRSLKVYSKNEYRNVPLESIDKLKVNDYTFICTGKVIIPIKKKYGTITFKLNDKTKFTTIDMNDVQSVKSKIDELRTYN